MIFQWQTALTQMLFSLRPDIETAVPADYTIGKLAADTNILNEYVNYKSYYDKVKKFQIGKQAFPGYVSLEGKTKIKDDTTGQIRTGIIRIPKLKIVSNLSVTLGERANPAVGTFYGVGYPTGVRGNSIVMETCILNDDIDSDIQ